MQINTESTLQNCPIYTYIQRYSRIRFKTLPTIAAANIKPVSPISAAEFINARLAVYAGATVHPSTITVVHVHFLLS